MSGFCKAPPGDWKVQPLPLPSPPLPSPPLPSLPLPTGLSRSTPGKCFPRCGHKHSCRNSFHKANCMGHSLLGGVLMKPPPHNRPCSFGPVFDPVLPLLTVLPFLLHKSRKAFTFGSCRRGEDPGRSHRPRVGIITLLGLPPQMLPAGHPRDHQGTSWYLCRVTPMF